MAGWQGIGRGLEQAGGAIAHTIYRSKWRKRKEEEEERKRKRELTRARIYGVPADHEVLKQVESLDLTGKEAADLYRHQLKEGQATERTAELPFKLQPLTEKGKPAGGKAPSYVTQQLIKETQRRATRKKAGEELKGRQERRQFGTDQGITGKALEYSVSKPKITEAQLGRLPGMPEKPPKAPADPMTKARKQKNAEIANRFNEKNLATRQEFAQQAQQTVGTFDAYLAREYAEEWQMVKQARETMQAIPPGALSKPLAKYQKLIDDKTSELMGDARVQAKIKLLQEMPFAPGDDAASDAYAAELRRQIEELKRLKREGEKTIDGLTAGN